MKNIYSLIAVFLLLAYGANAQTRIYTPTLKAPADGATAQMPDVLLDWDAVTGQGVAITYDVQLAQQLDFSDAVTFSDIPVTALGMNLLKFDEVYYWRVRANDGIDISEWSAPFSFRIITTVSIKEPNNNVVVHPNATIKWNEITGISNYDIQVDTVESWAKQNLADEIKLMDVFAVSSENVWAVGGGSVFHYDGNEWTSENVSEKPLNAIYFVNNKGWAAGNNGELHHYDGNSWSPENSGTDANLNGLFFVSETLGYAVGDGGTSLKYDGSTWTSVSTGVTVDLTSVHGLSANLVWVGGKGGNVAVFDGSSWQNSTITNRDILGIWVVSADKVWTSLKNGRIFHYNGVEWAEQTSTVTRDLNDICFIDANNGYAIGNTGSLIYYNGSAWQSLASGTTQDLFGLSILSAESGFVVGDKGTILTYQGEGFNSPYLKSFSTDGETEEFQFQNLVFGKNHLFRMRARHAESTSEWSTARLFTVIDKPTLSKPSNNAVNVHLDTLVSWEVISGVVGYTVQRATNPEFEDPFTFEAPTESYRFQGLGYGIDYYWRVNARHAGGVSDWSTPFKFTTATSVSLIYPENNATEIHRLPSVEWEEIRGTQKYWIQFCEDESFNCVDEHMSTTNTWQVQYLLDQDTRYFWRVRAIQGLDSTDWSPVWSFVTLKETSLEEFGLQSLKIYPNPSKGQFSIQLPAMAKNVEMELFAITGKQLLKQTFISGSTEQHHDLNISELGRGVYLIRLRSEDETVTRKLIIE